MPKQKSKKADLQQQELKLPLIPQLSAIKILEGLGKGEVHSSVLSRNQAVEMKKLKKDSDAESKRNSKVWIAKKTPMNVSPYEVAGLELLRLLSPVNQQKTRFFRAGDSDRIGVMSEKIPFSGIIKSNKKQQYSAEFLKGLGASTLLSLFLNETDLKLEHLDAKSGARIDGDWMFSSLISPQIFRKDSAVITEKDLRALPYVDKYKANNWLDQTEESKPGKGALMFSKLSPEEKKLVQEGINIATLHVLLLPDQVLKDFVNAYINNQEIKDKIYHFLLERKQQLYHASLANNDFVMFVSQLQEQDKNMYLGRLKNFITYQKSFLIKSDQAYVAVKYEVHKLLSGLHGQAKKQGPAKLVEDHGKVNNPEKSARAGKKNR
jgi:hypothetical protein